MERLGKERERARSFEGKELPVVESAVTVATGGWFFSLFLSLGDTKYK